LKKDATFEKEWRKEDKQEERMSGWHNFAKKKSKKN
jgi:hypothetical protein